MRRRGRRSPARARPPPAVAEAAKAPPPAAPDRASAGRRIRSRSEFRRRSPAAELSPAARKARLSADRPRLRRERRDGGSDLEEPLPRKVFEERLGGKAGVFLVRT